jgi:hypothetical protein
MSRTEEWEWGNSDEPAQFVGDTKNGFTTFLGFDLSFDWDFDYWRVVIPYWFLILLFGLLLCLVWRTSRLTPDAKMAFPLELAKPTSVQICKTE